MTRGVGLNFFFFFFFFDVCSRFCESSCAAELPVGVHATGLLSSPLYLSLREKMKKKVKLLEWKENESKAP